MEKEESAEKAALKIRSKTRRLVARLWSAPRGEHLLPYCVKQSTGFGVSRTFACHGLRKLVFRNRCGGFDRTSPIRTTPAGHLVRKFPTTKKKPPPPGPFSWPEVVGSNPAPATTAPRSHCAAAGAPTMPTTGSMSATGRVQTRA
jgi:hypothetical protein